MAICQTVEHDPADYFLKVFRTSSQITIDGEANEMVWQSAEAVGNFWELFPKSGIQSKTKTSVRAAYDDDFIYFLIEAYDSSGTFVAPSLKRDVSLAANDGVGVILDPINKKSNGFGFTCTPYNVQSEYQYGTDDASFTYAWDNKWFSEAKIYDDKYVIEMAIPFKTLRYKAENTTWGVNFFRSDRKKNQFSSWTNLPRQFSALDLAFLGTLQFEDNLGKQKNNISLNPYLMGGVYNDSQTNTTTTWKGFIPFKENAGNANYYGNVGFDAKVGVGEALNLDLTVNSDFSQVEVDQQVTNLTRYSILYPERRSFFLENSDIFSGFGNSDIKPFFSRRIGLDKNANPIPTLYGMRLSGNLMAKTRIGLMNLQTLKSGDYAAQNYTATALHQRIGKRSLVKGYFLNREALGLENEENVASMDKFGRNAGLELNLIDHKGVNRAWAGYHLSMKEGIEENRDFYQFGFGHFGKLYTGFVDFGNLKKDYYSDMGFVNRIETFAKIGDSYLDADTTVRAGFKFINNENHLTFRPKHKRLVELSFGQTNHVNYFEDGELSDRYHTLSSGLYFKNASSVNLEYKMHEDNIRFYFPLPSNMPLAPGNYNYSNFSLNYKGDARKNFVLNGGLLFGKYYNAEIRQYNMSMLLRKQPYFSMTLSAQYNDLLFPEDYGRTHLWLVGPKVEATITNKLFWTTFLQFNTQEDNFNINSRIQYRFSPMSDIYLVYTDNYHSDSFTNKNRAIVLKFNYWFSL